MKSREVQRFERTVEEWRDARYEWLESIDRTLGKGSTEQDTEKYLDAAPRKKDPTTGVPSVDFFEGGDWIPESVRPMHDAAIRFANATRDLVAAIDRAKVGADTERLINLERCLLSVPILPRAEAIDASVDLVDFVESVMRKAAPDDRPSRGIKPTVLKTLECVPPSTGKALMSIKQLVRAKAKDMEGGQHDTTAGKHLKVLRDLGLVEESMIRRTREGDRVVRDRTR